MGLQISRRFLSKSKTYVANGRQRFDLIANIFSSQLKPIWAFCKQGTHCSAGGMVFAANADETSNKSFAAFQALAKGGSSTSAYPPTQSSGAWRPSSSMVVVLGLFAAALLL
jgi:hypothetical protein